MIYHTKVSGPLAELADGFRTELEDLGYTEGSREFKIAEAARLSDWLEAHGLGVADICLARLEEFLADWAVRSTRVPTLVAMGPLLVWLRGQGLCAAEPSPTVTPLDELLECYHYWLVTERQLASRTIRRYEQLARLFLGERALLGFGPAGIDGLDEEAVTTFLLAQAASGLAAQSLQGRVAELRSLLRFLFLRTLIPTQLGEGIPAVPGWKDTGVPYRMAAADVQLLLQSCDRETVAGMRNFAILLLLARLGLRAAEVSGLKLEDFDWQVGELVVTGKGWHRDRMPLSNEVGEAVASYLSKARPTVRDRVVFLTLVAPMRQMGSTAVSQTVWRQCRIAGLQPVRAHRLRHSLATELLSRGVKLPEIAQVLRHRDLATTAVYAKVDHRALGELARPWLVIS